jgi:hypothetical protein
MSGTTWLLIGIGQGSFMLALSTVFLFLYSRRLKQRAKSLTKRLGSQSQLHRKTIDALKAQLTQVGGAAQTAPNAAAPVEVPGGEFSGLVDRNIKQTEERLIALGAEPNTQFQADDSAEIIAARMRHAFLESEKLVLAFSTDPALMWETLQPNIDRITMGLRRHYAALMGNDDAFISKNTQEDQSGEVLALKEKLEALERRWHALESHAESCLSVLDERYDTLTLALAKESANSQVHQHADALANRFIHILNNITEANHPEKHYQTLLSTVIPETSDPTEQAVEESVDDPFSDIPQMELDAESNAQAASEGADNLNTDDLDPNAIAAEALAELEANPELQQEAEIDALAEALAEAQEDTSEGDDIEEFDLATALNEENVDGDGDNGNIDVNESSPSDLTDDIDALLVESEARLKSRAIPTSEDSASNEETSGITETQKNALDEELAALTEETSVEEDEETTDPLAALDIDDEDAESNDEALSTPISSSAAQDDDELDPDAIIAAALAETEDGTKDSTEDNNLDAPADDPMDEMTFEDLLADSGVDLHGSLDYDDPPPT